MGDLVDIPSVLANRIRTAFLGGPSRCSWMGSGRASSTVVALLGIHAPTVAGLLEADRLADGRVVLTASGGCWPTPSSATSWTEALLPG